jgi:hypothetical protein
VTPRPNSASELGRPSSQKPDLCTDFCARDPAGQAETGETQKARDDFMPRVCRGQRGHQRLPETPETAVRLRMILRTVIIGRQSQERCLAGSIRWRLHLRHPRRVVLRIAGPEPCSAILLRLGEQPEVLLIRRQTRLEHVGPAELLKLRRDLTEIHVRMIAAAGADELKHTGVAAFHPAIDDADRAAAQDGRPAMPGLTRRGERQEDLSADTQPRITLITRAARRRGADWRGIQPGTVNTRGWGTAHFSP